MPVLKNLSLCTEITERSHEKARSGFSGTGSFYIWLIREPELSSPASQADPDLQAEPPHWPAGTPVRRHLQAAESDFPH